MSLDWLVARPIAHRGLHERSAGLIENSLAAADAAIARGFAIECDVQMSADGEAFVFHDETLERLTGASGHIGRTQASDLVKLRLTGATGDARIPPLADFLAQVAGRVPVVIEIKSLFDGDMRLAERAARIVASHDGRLALKSFDPAVVAHLRRSGAAGGAPLGVVAQARYEDAEWDFLMPQAKESMACLLHWRDTRPDFISFAVNDLPNAAVHLARAALRLPVMTWTVRTPAQWAMAKRHADQAIFEGRVA